VRGVGDIKAALVALSDEVWHRTRRRLEGLTDEELRWEPVPGCWSIRQLPDGTWAADGVRPSPDPAPFTTVGWRLWHLIDMYGEDRAPRWLDVPPQGPAIGLDDPTGAPPATAAGALDLLDRAHDRWDAHLALVTEEQLTQPIGPVGGAYADNPRSGYVLHMLDEFIHHGAEISLLRDLWRWSQVSGRTMEERAVLGDRTLAAEIEDPSAAIGLVEQAASYGRWELVLDLARRGAPIPSTGRTPLHLAASVGRADVVRALLDLGADASATDPDFHATPLQWAGFLGHPAVEDVLRSHTGG